MIFSKKFRTATHEYATFDRFVPAPYLRRAVNIPTDKVLSNATLTICGLGFYRLFVNGREYTRGLLSPYITNPDLLLFYDTYDVTDKLTVGKNALGFLLGNGMQNSMGGKIWDFDVAAWRSAPMVAFALELTYTNGERQVIEADDDLCTLPSPIYFDDLRVGEFYDATAEIPGWSEGDFDDSAWQETFPVMAPRGECRLSTCDPIIRTKELHPQKIYRGGIGEQARPRGELSVYPMRDVEAETEGWIYDFGVNAAGICRLHIRAHAGQKIVMQFCEEVTTDGSGNLDLRGMSFLPIAFNHRNIYICREGEQEWKPGFAYHGFRYCLVLGLTDEQVTEDLLTYEVMNSDIRPIGDFTCSDETVNRITEAAHVADLANFYFFPTDCPHREKNGWTADAALSAEHILTYFRADESYRQWLRLICRTQDPDGSLPGIVPTDRWGHAWGNGPAWDSVLFYLPYYLYQYRGDTKTIRKCAAHMMRYLHYLTTRRDANGLLAFGLGDWCQTGRINQGDPTSPQIFTDSVISMDLCAKAAIMFRAVGMSLQAAFAENLRAEIRAAVRKHLIQPATLVARGNCQTSQAMALYYGVYEPGECSAAFAVLLEMIEKNQRRMDVGVLGARVLFHVLSAYGQTALAYEMVTTKEFPSYAYWIHTMGATSLHEDFIPRGKGINSHNHHFWGDISSWFARELGGLKINPWIRDANEVEISPQFIDALQFAEVENELPCGKISIKWERKEGMIHLYLHIPEGAKGKVLLGREWCDEQGHDEIPLRSGEYCLIPVGSKNKGMY